MAAEPWILGLGGSHNGGACLLKGSEVVVAVQEERLSGIKRHFTWLAEDTLSITYCLQAADLEPEQIDAIAVSALPSLHAPRHDVSRNPALAAAARSVPIVPVGHHFAHAAGAYAMSGFDDAALLVIDGSGTTAGDLTDDEHRVVVGHHGSEAISMYRATGQHMTPLAKYMTGPDGWLGVRDGGMRAFGTLGGMYSAIADQIFGDVHAAGKVMGLAPCGNPTIPVREFLHVEDGALQFSGAVAGRFRHDLRWPDCAEAYADLAASAQAALEAGLAALITDLGSRVGGLHRLCYGGGVALNVVANDRVVAPAAQELFILPAAEDSGIALGAAYAALWRLTGSAHHPRPRLRRDSTGRAYDEGEIAQAIRRTPAVTARRSSDVVGETCDRLAAGQVVGWFQDGSELGPRSLGQRTLLCDPRHPEAKARLNARVKYRESFRPFAPVLPEAAVPDWFAVDEPVTSPFMLSAPSFRDEQAPRVPAVVHVDGTGRLQTVDGADHPLLDRLLAAWTSLTGVPILLNTSFNLAGEPIVETPADALRCLLSSGIDCCVVGSWIAEPSGDGSVLDLYPRRTGRQTASADASGGAYATLTPWGTVNVMVEGLEDRVISTADGDVCARDLVARHAPNMDPLTAVQLMHRLWRLRLLSFHQERPTSPAAV
jgi:carbamoyltransferase